MSHPDPVALIQGLIRCPSITPLEGGAIRYIETVLARAGFTCHRLPFSEPGTPDIDNLYARIGTGSPHLCFAGHTDVVPPGDEAAWTHPPFLGEIADGSLFGRGAADMKGGIGCFLAAALDHLAEAGADFRGSISVLITGDEEGPAINGTQKVLDWMRAAGEQPDHCLVGEPTSPDHLGQNIKIGRRGSISARLVVSGKQGHVAYPERARNPLPGLIAVLQSYLAEPLDHGTDHFAPSNLEVTSIDVGNPTENIIPVRAEARLNIRFNDRQTADGLRALLTAKTEAALEGSGLHHELIFAPANHCFLTEPGPLVALLSDAVRDVTGVAPELSTAGGTSDARYIKDLCPVVEFGLASATIHQVDERVPIVEIEGLTAIYRTFLGRYFEAFAHG